MAGIKVNVSGDFVSENGTMQIEQIEHRQDALSSCRLLKGSYYYMPNIGIDWLNLYNSSLNDIAKQIENSISEYGGINVNITADKVNTIEYSFFIP